MRSKQPSAPRSENHARYPELQLARAADRLKHVHAVEMTKPREAQAIFLARGDDDFPVESEMEERFSKRPAVMTSGVSCVALQSGGGGDPSQHPLDAPQLKKRRRSRARLRRTGYNRGTTLELRQNC